MSCPRYMLTLSVSGLPDLDMKITTKLKTKLGDIDFLEKELLYSLEQGNIRHLVECLHKDNGGIEAMARKWGEQYVKYLESFGRNNENEKKDI